MNNSPFFIRPGEACDVPTIALFMLQLAMETEQLKLDPSTVERGVGAAMSDASKGRYFVAQSEQQVIGCLMITREWSDWRDGDMWWLQSVYVQAQHRGKGVLKAMYQSVVSEAKSAGVRCVRLYVEHNNAAAKSTYAKLGFDVTHYQVMESPV